MGVLFYSRSDGQYILVSETIMAVFLFIIILSNVLTVDVLFYFRSDIKYIIVSDTIMAVYLLIFILYDILIDSGRLFLPKVRWTIYFSW